MFMPAVRSKNTLHGTAFLLTVLSKSNPVHDAESTWCVVRAVNSCLSLCVDCQTVTSSDNCQCICYYGDSSTRCGA